MNGGDPKSLGLSHPEQINSNDPDGRGTAALMMCVPPTVVVDVAETSGITPNDGAICGGDMVTLTAVTNRQLNFDGDNDYVNSGDVTDLNNATQFTIEMMVNSAKRDVYRTLFSKRTTETLAIQLQFNVVAGFNKLTFLIGDGTSSVRAVSQNDFPLNTWTHVAVVYDASGATNADKIKMYWNGVLKPLIFIGAVAVSDPYAVPPSTGNNTAPVLLGAENTSPTDITAFQGAMNDVRIWNRALSVAEISSMQNSCVNTTSGLILNYLMDEVLGSNTASNNASASYTGALNNFNTATAWSTSTSGCNYTSASWSGGISNNVPFSPLTTTTYTVTVTGSDGCTATASSTVTILQDAGITVSETSGLAPNDGTICQGDQATLTATGGTSYLWNTGQTTATLNVSPAATTTYTVTVSNASGCVSTATSVITVNAIPQPPVNRSVCRSASPIDLLSWEPAGVLFSGPGVTGSTFNPAAIPSGTSTAFIQVTYACNIAGRNTNQANIQVNMLDAPVADLKETLGRCLTPGSTFPLQSMFEGNNSSGGTFSTTPVYPLTSDNQITVPNADACISVTYTVSSSNGCGTATATEDLLLTVMPNPSFSISNAPNGPVCSAGGSITVTVTRTSNGANPVLTMNGQPASFGTLTLNAPTSTGSVSYDICLTETGNTPGACGSTLPDANYSPCSRQFCQRIVIYNDGVNCGNGAPFPSECAPDLSQSDPCTVDVHPGLELNCSIIRLSTPDLISTSLDPDKDVIFCSDESVDVYFTSSVAGFGDAITGGPTIGELPGIGFICELLEFEICAPWPLDDWCFDPFFPGTSFEDDICDKNLSQFILSTLGAIAGGDGGGGQVVADTDGDGAFDVLLKDFNFPDAGTLTVPNNVTTSGGTITVRNVAAFPTKAVSSCGVVSPPGLNLLDLIPLGAIPLAGAIIEDIISSLGCDIELQLSNEATVEIPVINNEPPVFSNCNVSGYTFYENGACTTPINWSIPVAFDGCYGSNLPYKGRTAATDDSYFTGNPPPVATVTASGLYQTGGPLIGSEVPVGEHMVTYTAYSCAGVSTACTFQVRVLAGTPVLECPNDMTIRNDVDQCSAVVTGLTPVRGVSCNSIINYSVDYPAAAATLGFTDVATNTTFSAANLGTHNDASGLAFPVGTTTVTYTLLVDINGDNDVTDADETQTCSFTVTVLDAQKPHAVCKDISVRLNNTGSATIYSNLSSGNPFIDGGSTDNCPGPLSIQIARSDLQFSNAINLDCSDVGIQYVNLRVTDAAGNISNCLSNVTVEDFLGDIVVEMNLPQLCLEANNPVQFDFNNYTNITLPNGQTIRPSDVAANSYLGDVIGGFAISAFLPHPGTTSTDPGSITSAGIYTPGQGTGYVTVSYMVLLPGSNVNNVGVSLAHCFQIFHSTFELRQPLDMASPECVCVMQGERIVDLGVVSGGLEPYRIQYTGVRLDVDGDGMEEDADGDYTYDVAHGHDIDDFEEDLGELRVVYTQPVWSFTIVDARGCELFRSGSCDNDDDTEGPQITCPASNNTLTTEEYLCESQYEWKHPLPTDNCAVVQYDYRIINPDGTIDGPHNLNTLLNALQNSTYFNAVYEFQLGVSIVSYYAADAQGNSITCTFQITVTDDDPPHFINCPYPPVVQNAESGHCDAYVDFALPLATDNCDIPTVTQIDNSGLTTGDRFPVGTTIMYWEAIDLAGNKDTCQVKVIVNDYWQMPILDCPGDVTQNNDLWLCGAVVNNIAPDVEGPCENNYGITYTIYADAAQT
ncbi:MAG: HYR domain-containing protein, partial [Saprospiraceae bacterium]|nr:HYR domain-containing protein [Saprospiraceae bacterium]